MGKLESVLTLKDNWIMKTLLRSYDCSLLMTYVGSSCEI